MKLTKAGLVSAAVLSGGSAHGAEPAATLIVVISGDQLGAGS